MGYKPFENDMFTMVYDAFRRLYPDKTCEIEWGVDLEDDDGNKCYGITNFCDDGTVQVFIDAGAPVIHAVETLAHELAHVAVGHEADHNADWQAAFDALYREYMKVGDEMFPDIPAKTVEVVYPMEVNVKEDFENGTQS